MVAPDFRPNVYLLLPLLSGTLMLVLALWAARQRPWRFVWPFVLLSFAVAEWSYAYAVALGVYELNARVFWAKLQYLGIAAVAPLWLILVARNTGREHLLSLARQAALFLPPAFGTALVLTNEHHGLIWQETAVNPAAGFSYFQVRYGPAFWLYLGYNYALLAAGIVLLTLSLRRATAAYRGQAAGLIASAVFPVLGNLLYVFRLFPPPALDVTVLAFAATAALAGWSLYRYRLFDLMPVARDQIVEIMSDGLIVVDRRGRIVDVNAAACHLLGGPGEGLVGRTITEAFPFLEAALAAGETLAVPSAEAGAPRYVAARASSLLNHRKEQQGQVILLHDITEQRRNEEALRLAEQRAARLQTAAEIGATVAHELAQPLAVISGYLELLRTRPVEPEQQAKMLADIAAAAGVLAQKIRVIEGLQDYVTKSYGEGMTVVDLERSVEAGRPEGDSR